MHHTVYAMGKPADDRRIRLPCARNGISGQEFTGFSW